MFGAGKQDRNPPETHLNIYAPASRKFVEIAANPYMGEPDISISLDWAEGLESFYWRPRKQAEQITAPILGYWDMYVSETSRDLHGGGGPIRAVFHGSGWSRSKLGLPAKRCTFYNSLDEIGPHKVRGENQNSWGA